MNSCYVRFPYPVTGNLSQEEVDKWFKFYKKSTPFFKDGRYEEGLWRRTQSEENKDASGWNEDEDSMRRRVVHYEYKYDLVKDGHGKAYYVAIIEFYLWWHIYVPNNEIAVHLERLYAGLHLSGWRKIFGFRNDEKIFSFGDLYVKILECNPEENVYDQFHACKFPDHYSMLEITFFSKEIIRTKILL